MTIASRFDFGDVVLVPVFSTIEQGLVIRVLGHLSATDLQSLQGLLGNVIG